MSNCDDAGGMGTGTKIKTFLHYIWYKQCWGWSQCYHKSVRAYKTSKNTNTQTDKPQCAFRKTPSIMIKSTNMSKNPQWNQKPQEMRVQVKFGGKGDFSESVFTLRPIIISKLTIKCSIWVLFKANHLLISISMFSVQLPDWVF